MDDYVKYKSGTPDWAYDTTLQNVKLNPQLLEDMPELKAYLLNKAVNDEAFWRWSKQKTKYTLEDDVNKIIKGKKGSGIHDQEIEFLKDQLNNGSTEDYNFSSIRLMRKRLAYLEKNN